MSSAESAVSIEGPTTDASVEGCGVFTTYRVCQKTLSRVELPKVVGEIIGWFDGDRTVAQVARESQISETKILAVVRKLTRQGVLLRPTDKSSKDPTSKHLLKKSAQHPVDDDPPLFGPEADQDSMVFSDVETKFFTDEYPAVVDECDEPFETLAKRVRRTLARWIHPLLVRLDPLCELDT